MIFSHISRLRAADAMNSLALLRALAALVIVEVGVRALSLGRLGRVLGVELRVEGEAGGGGFIPAVVEADEELLMLARSVTRVSARWPFGDTCLRRALALGWLIRSRNPELRLGIKRTPHGVRGHAWLELSGQALDPEIRSSVRPLRRSESV